MLVALVGLAVVLAVQVRANRDLTAANDRERARFDLAMEAIKSFHTGVSEDLLLKEPQFQRAAHQAAARGARVLRQARGPARGSDRSPLAASAGAGLRRAGRADRQDRFEDRGAGAVPPRAGAAAGAGAGRAGRRRCASRGRPVPPGPRYSPVPDRPMPTRRWPPTRRRAPAGWAAVVRPGPARDFRADLATCDHLIGDLLAATGRPAEALAWYRRARSLREALERETAPPSPDSAAAWRRARSPSGILLWKGGHPAEAVDSFEKARALFEALVRGPPRRHANSAASSRIATTRSATRCTRSARPTRR